VALANAPPEAVADQRQAVKRRSRIRSRVLTWFASRWRNHQPKRAEKPHSKSSVVRRWTALLRGRRLRLPWRIASGSRQPPRGVRLMSARERELGELPSPICPCLAARPGRDLFFAPWNGNVYAATSPVAVFRLQTLVGKLAAENHKPQVPEPWQSGLRTEKRRGVRFLVVSRADY